MAFRLLTVSVPSDHVDKARDALEEFDPHRHWRSERHEDDEQEPSEASEQPTDTATEANNASNSSARSRRPGRRSAESRRRSLGRILDMTLSVVGSRRSSTPNNNS